VNHSIHCLAFSFFSLIPLKLDNVYQHEPSLVSAFMFTAVHWVSTPTDSSAYPCHSVGSSFAESMLWLLAKYNKTNSAIYSSDSIGFHRIILKQPLISSLSGGYDWNHLGNGKMHILVRPKIVKVLMCLPPFCHVAR
jgi:hypothetical protein